MELTTYTKERNLVVTENKSELLDSFLTNSHRLGNETLKVEKDLFVEAANNENIQFELIRMKNCQLNRVSKNISNAKNALIEADFAIADSGFLVVDTQDKDVLLSIYMAEILHLVVPASKILHSMDDFELIKEKSAVVLGRGIASDSVSSLSKELYFAKNIVKTMVYVLEDL
ncbi:LUD domain-containing protein [Labilibaculum sp.]|uniref:LUD domain-containing protein n=1 Tax=Labilibaculum sp. TaxID=2060723 RepID=UPI0035637793